MWSQEERWRQWPQEEEEEEEAVGGGTERDKQNNETDRQTDRQRETDREAGAVYLLLNTQTFKVENHGGRFHS